MQIYWTKINKIIEESPEVKTFFLDLPEGFTWEEGAHTHLAIKGFNVGEKPNKSLVRHMSISTLPSENSVTITTRIKEQCSEFKSILKTMSVGDELALFKIHSNVPLKREEKNLYLLSSGVGLATFRPIVLSYFENQENIKSVYSLNIDSANDRLFTDIFTTVPEKNFTAQTVQTRADYYETAENLATDQNGIYYVIGSDEFILQNIELLTKHGITREQIVLDKRERFMEKFFSTEVTV